MCTGNPQGLNSLKWRELRRQCCQLLGQMTTKTRFFRGCTNPFQPSFLPYGPFFCECNDPMQCAHCLRLHVMLMLTQVSLYVPVLVVVPVGLNRNAPCPREVRPGELQGKTCRVLHIARSCRQLLQTHRAHVSCWRLSLCKGSDMV